MHVDGNCHCGAIRFEAEVDPKRVGICHCTDCQIFSGSAFRTGVIVLAPDFRLLEGTPVVYGKIAESGAPRRLAFCGSCGTHVYGMTEGDPPKFYSIRVGALAQREELPPVAQIWCRSRLPWVANISDLFEVPMQPGD